MGSKVKAYDGIRYTMCAIRKLPASNRALYVTRKPPEARQHAPRVRSPLIDDPSHSLTRMHPSSAGRRAAFDPCARRAASPQRCPRAPGAAARGCTPTCRCREQLACARRDSTEKMDKFRSTFGSKRQKAEGPSFQIWLLSHSSFELTPSTHIRHTSACRDHMLPPWWRGVAFCLVCPAPCTHTYKLSGMRAGVHRMCVRAIVHPIDRAPPAHIAHLPVRAPPPASKDAM